MNPVGDQREDSPEPTTASLSREDLEEVYNELGNLIVAKDSEACRARNELIATENEKRRQLQEHIDKLGEYIHQLEGEQHKIPKLQQHIDQLGEYIHQLEGEPGGMNELQKHIEELENQLKDLGRHCEFLKATHAKSLEVLGREVLQMRNSLSWRITRPLRSLVLLLTRGRK